MNGTQPEWIQMARLAVTVLRSVCRNHVEQQERWKTGTVETTRMTKVGKHTGK